MRIGGGSHVFLLPRSLDSVERFGVVVAAVLVPELAIVLGHAPARSGASDSGRRNCAGLVGYWGSHSCLTVSGRGSCRQKGSMINPPLQSIAVPVVADSDLHNCLAASARDFVHRSGLTTVLLHLHSIAAAVVGSDWAPSLEISGVDSVGRSRAVVGPFPRPRSDRCHY